ncbi:MAG: hypothetical protein APG12_01542 [Candidatus Methanofastidiosum methylothiophilum]|jgi:hypothetical protein|uniref:Apea-like HEPN domain-containing protein n=1 Tax=Candidatus Methanofastidiosum methylothiophilum TaxID=1705564 RepID=A0A150IIS3_9EURY|nr:MAG: hypothetical protein APG10_01382 [Candidatus Methanofastidiosum methylthiophilus]KYC49346.1 MAG: hypothetical protein APG12_01542 [Candidatus Methanofastidiosum methylthiophilus]
MSRFLVLLAAKTIVSLPGNGRVIVGDTEILFREISDERDRNLSGLKYGWLIDIRLNKENIDNAIIKAWEISEFFLNNLCLETGVPVHDSKVLLSYEITENTKKRIFRQYLNIDPKVSGVEIDLRDYSNHGNKINEYNRKRVFRAIRSFRKGVNASDPLDQFYFFWHGLESLNPILAETYEIKDDKGKRKTTKLKEIGRTCEHCGKGCKTTIPAGIEALYDDLNIDEKLRKQLADTRTGLVHGIKSIKELTNEALKLLPGISMILHHGISSVLRISFKESVYNNLQNIHPTKMGEINYIQGYLRLKDLSNIESGYYPYLSLKSDADGEFTVVTETYCNIENVEFSTSGNVILDANLKLH